MKKWDLISEIDAIRLIDRILRIPRTGYESVPSELALERVSAEDIVSAIDVPGFRRSSVDGYAVSTADFKGGSTAFRFAFEVEMGRMPDRDIMPGECAYVPTGGALPKSADAVVMIEDSARDGNVVTLKSIGQGENFVMGNEDFSRGEKIIEAGKILNAADLGKISAIGKRYIKVIRKPKVFAISTGDELESDVSISVPKPGKVFNINLTSIENISNRFGFENAGHTLAKDDFNSLRATFEEALDIADIIIFSGGSSVGEKDFVARVIESFEDARIIFHGIRIKPGKPAILANIGEKVILGLPGHPASAFMIYSHFGSHLASRRFGTLKPARLIRAKLDSDLNAPPDRDTLQIIRLSENPDFERDGEYYTAEPVFGKSAVISKISECDGYVMNRVDGGGFRKGDSIYVHPFAY